MEKRVGPCVVSASAETMGVALKSPLSHQAVSSRVTSMSSPPALLWRTGWSCDKCPPLPLGLRARTAHRDLYIKGYWREEWKGSERAEEGLRRAFGSGGN